MLEFFNSYIARVWGQTLWQRMAWAICVAVVFELLLWLLSRRLRRAFAPILQRDVYLDATERVKRRKVILGLPLLLLRIVLYVFALLIMLRYLGFNTGAELVPVGIGLLAAFTIIFWSTLRDCVAGYFIMYDGLYNTGDRVTIGDQGGIVMEVGLRYTKLRVQNGLEVAIANSTITQVTNHSRASDLERKTQRL